MSERIFANGFFAKRNEGAPDFVLANHSIKVDEAIKTLQENSKNGWVNIVTKRSKSGSAYVEIDTWEPPKEEEEATVEEAEPEEMPF